MIANLLLKFLFIIVSLLNPCGAKYFVLSTDIANGVPHRKILHNKGFTRALNRSITPKGDVNDVLGCGRKGLNLRKLVGYDEVEDTIRDLRPYGNGLELK